MKISAWNLTMEHLISRWICLWNSGWMRCKRVRFRKWSDSIQFRNRSNCMEMLSLMQHVLKRKTFYSNCIRKLWFNVCSTIFICISVCHFQLLFLVYMGRLKVTLCICLLQYWIKSVCERKLNTYTLCFFLDCKIKANRRKKY